MGWHDHDEATILGYGSVEGKRACRNCIGEQYLQSIAGAQGEPGECSYCGEETECCVEVDVLVPIVTRGILSEYEDAANSVGYCGREGGYQLPIMDNLDIIQDVFDGEETAQELLEDLVQAIPALDWVKKDPYGPWPQSVLISAWDSFSDQVKHDCRFMFFRLKVADPDDPDDPDEPYEILTKLGKIVTRLGLVNVLPKGHQLFRLRVHDKNEVFKTAEELGPPPDEFAGANRMSPAGISVFYGADSLKTAIAETFDPSRGAGKIVTTARFRAVHHLRVLDFSNLPPVPSIFDEEWWGSRYLLVFLHQFLADVTQPIEKDGRVHIDYVPTQIVAEFFRHVFQDKKGRKLDGIQYPSARAKGGFNCVIFTKHGEVNDAAEGHSHPDAKLELVKRGTKRITPARASKLMASP